MSPKGLRRSCAHTSAQYDTAIIQKFEDVSMIVRSMPMSSFAIAESLRMRRVVIGTEFPRAQRAAFRLENYESLALAEMLRNRYSVDCRDCDLHNSSWCFS